MPSLTQTQSDRLLDTLAKLGGQSVKADDITFDGTRFVIPASLTLTEAVQFLAAKALEDESTTTFHKTFPYRPYDGARAASAVFNKTFGSVVAKSSMFDPASLVTVATDYDKTEQVPWGIVQLPIMPGVNITLTDVRDPKRGDLFRMKVEGPRKYRHHVDGLFALVAEELAHNSLYRGKAINGDMDFLDLSRVDPDKVTYSADVMTQLQRNLWDLIQHTDSMREAGVSLKRSILLEGPYGTGKTMAAYLTAKLAVMFGWSFHFCGPDDTLADVMQTAALYQPAVVFFEDVDTLADPRRMRPDSVSRLLDTFDGIAGKGAEIIMVLTTNHVGRLHKGMLRPGRLDAIVPIGALDRDGCENLCRNIIGTLLAPSVDFDAVYESAEGYLPSFVVEACDRAIRYAIAAGKSRGGPAATVTTQDLVDAMAGMRGQFTLMMGAEENTPEPSDLASAMGAVVESAVANAGDVMADRIESTVHDATGSVESAVESAGYEVREATDRIVEGKLDATEIRDSYGDRTGNLRVSE